jgi:hypothetical protein
MSKIKKGLVKLQNKYGKGLSVVVLMVNNDFMCRLSGAGYRKKVFDLQNKFLGCGVSLFLRVGGFLDLKDVRLYSGFLHMGQCLL